MSDKQAIAKFSRAHKAWVNSYPKSASHGSVIPMDGPMWVQTTKGWYSRLATNEDLNRRHKLAVEYANRAAKRGDWS